MTVHVLRARHIHQQLSKLKSVSVRRMSTSSVRRKSMLDVAAMLHSITESQQPVASAAAVEEEQGVSAEVQPETVMEESVVEMAVEMAAEKRSTAPRAHGTVKVISSGEAAASSIANRASQRRRSMSGLAESLDSILKSTESINTTAKQLGKQVKKGLQPMDENVNLTNVAAADGDSRQKGKGTVIAASDYKEVWLDI